MIKTKIEIIEETYNYYSEDVSRRAYVGEDGCSYLTEDGRMCAFGRCCKNPGEIQELLKISSDPTHGSYMINKLVEHKKTIEDVLKEEYKGHTVLFWRALQGFHDSILNWNEKGITEWGLKRYEELKKEYANSPIS